MNSHLMRRTAAAGLVVVALAGTAGCARHTAGTDPSTPPVQHASTTTPLVAAAQPTSTSATVPTPTQTAGAAQTRSQAVSALGTAIDQAGAAASSQSSDLSASAGKTEGDPTS